MLEMGRARVCGARGQSKQTFRFCKHLSREALGQKPPRHSDPEPNLLLLRCSPASPAFISPRHAAAALLLN